MPIDMFLKIDGLPGESQDAKHKDEIEIESFSFGLTPTGDTKLEVQAFQFTSRASKASPQLFLQCAKGTHFNHAVLTLRKAGERQLEFLFIKLTDVLVTSYQMGGSSGDVVPVDSFSLNFARVEETYVPERADGTPGEPVTVAFDVKDVGKRG